MSFQENLKELRTKKGLSQKKLADEIGVAQSSINYWESGQRVPNIEACTRMAEFFHVDLRDLLDLDAELASGNNNRPIVSVRRPYTINSDEYDLLKLFDKLNDEGQDKAIEQVELLTKIPEYLKDSD